MLKRCKTTYLRQATKIPNLNKSDVLNLKHENLGRYNRSFEVFKNMRGTSMYYEESKKNVMALMRQNGCPSIFFTLSMAEFDWQELLQEIIETVYRQKVTKEQVEGLSSNQKNKIISENYVQSTLHCRSPPSHTRSHPSSPAAASPSRSPRLCVQVPGALEESFLLH